MKNFDELNRELTEKLPSLFNICDRKEEKLAQIIFGLRNQQKLTQEQLAKKAGVPNQMIFVAEGYRPGFQDADYERIFEALGYTFHDVLKTVDA